MQQVAVARSDIRIRQVLVNLQRLGLHPLTVFPVESLLGDFADVNLRIEVGGESLMVVTGIAVHNVEILDFIEMVFGSIGSEDARDTRIEATTEDSGQTSLTEAVAIRPLPGVFEMRLIFRLVVGRIEIVTAARQTSIHNGQVLIRQREVDDQFRFEVIEQGLQLLHIVGIDLGG